MGVVRRGHEYVCVVCASILRIFLQHKKIEPSVLGWYFGSLDILNFVLILCLNTLVIYVLRDLWQKHTLSLTIFSTSFGFVFEVIF